MQNDSHSAHTGAQCLDLFVNMQQQRSLEREPTRIRRARIVNGHQSVVFVVVLAATFLVILVLVLVLVLVIHAIVCRRR